MAIAMMRGDNKTLGPRQGPQNEMKQFIQKQHMLDGDDQHNSGGDANKAAATNPPTDAINAAAGDAGATGEIPATADTVEDEEGSE